jgi:hypothetical protein
VPSSPHDDGSGLPTAASGQYQPREASHPVDVGSVALPCGDHASYPSARIVNIPLATRYQVNMAMEYRLPRLGTDVDANVIPDH